MQYTTEKYIIAVLSLDLFQLKLCHRRIDDHIITLGKR